MFTISQTKRSLEKRMKFVKRRRKWRRFLRPYSFALLFLVVASSSSCSFIRARSTVRSRSLLIISALNKEFDYDDIPKRSMLSDTRQFKPLVSKLAMGLSIPIYPSVDTLVKRYGSERYREQIVDRIAEYKVQSVFAVHE